MKKKILFLISNLESGGVSKSITSLLNAFDRKRYDITLWIANPTGVFMGLLPDGIRIIHDKRIADLTSGMGGIASLLKDGHIGLALGSMLRVALSAIDKSWAGRLLAWLMPATSDDEYDLIVDYNGQQQLYYMVDKLRGKKKITFFHSDYDRWPYYKNADKRYFPKVDGIYTISEICLNSLKRNFPAQVHKMGVIENITSASLIKSMSENSFKSPWREGVVKILTVGHVCESKGSHWAIEAASLLKREGLNFQWVFIGGISDEKRYRQLAHDMNVDDSVIFAGITPNPYPYMAEADIIVHPSQYEGKSIALDEAKILARPIVVTNFSTVGDQFEDRVNASICEMNPQAIAESIIELANSPDLKERYISYLQSRISDNSAEVIERFEEIING